MCVFEEMPCCLFLLSKGKTIHEASPAGSAADLRPPKVVSTACPWKIPTSSAADTLFAFVVFLGKLWKAQKTNPWGSVQNQRFFRLF